MTLATRQNISSGSSVGRPCSSFIRYRRASTRRAFDDRSAGGRSSGSTSNGIGCDALIGVSAGVVNYSGPDGPTLPAHRAFAGRRWSALTDPENAMYCGASIVPPLQVGVKRGRLSTFSTACGYPENAGMVRGFAPYPQLFHRISWINPAGFMAPNALAADQDGRAVGFVDRLCGIRSQRMCTGTCHECAVRDLVAWSGLLVV